MVAAMTGGVDSSVTAALLKRQGYDVVGITLQLYPSGTRPSRKGACCAGADIYDAKRVAQSLEHSALCAGLRKPLPQAGDRGFRRKLCPRRNAHSLRALQ